MAFAVNGRQDGAVTLRPMASNIPDTVAHRTTSLLKDYAPLAGRDVRVRAGVRR